MLRYFEERNQRRKKTTTKLNGKKPGWHKKGDVKDINNYKHISLLSHMYKVFTQILQKRMETVRDENQSREQTGFRKDNSTVDHLQTMNQLTEKSNGFKRLLCIGYIDFEIALDTIEHEAVLKHWEQ